MRPWILHKPDKADGCCPRCITRQLSLRGDQATMNSRESCRLYRWILLSPTIRSSVKHFVSRHFVFLVGRLPWILSFTHTLHAAVWCRWIGGWRVGSLVDTSLQGALLPRTFQNVAASPTNSIVSFNYNLMHFAVCNKCIMTCINNEVESVTICNFLYVGGKARSKTTQVE